MGYAAGCWCYLLIFRSSCSIFIAVFLVNLTISVVARMQYRTMATILAISNSMCHQGWSIMVLSLLLIANVMMPATIPKNIILTTFRPVFSGLNHSLKFMFYLRFLFVAFVGCRTKL